MIFKNISQDNKTLYTLNKGEQCVFFMLNRSDDIVFELAGEGATAHVFAFFIGKKNEQGSLSLSQRHLAPRTTSRVLVKSVLSGTAQFSYHGTLHISKQATLSDAAQENRNLLLSQDAKAFSKPALEILTNDVRCRHAATTGPLNQELLFFAKTRGLSQKQAQKLLINGFLRSSLDTMSTLISSQNSKEMLALVKEAAIL